jgi:hypothetical protein
MTLVAQTPYAALRERFRGQLIEPDDPRWESATETFNVTVRQRPALVAIPADEDDVVGVVTFARDAGMQIAAQRTGHNAGPLGDLDDVILVRTDALQGVEIDVVRRTARVCAGSTWADVVPAASAVGLAALHGSTPNVSVAGYSLGGGIGWYARKLGLAANSITAIELVTADGTLRRVDSVTDPDLFWGLRGGGGNFGVVTALEIELYPVAEVYAGVLFFELERAAEVLHTWLDWTVTVPDEVTSVGRILRFPPLPEVPDAMRGRAFAVVEAVVLGDEAAGAALLAPLRALGPSIDTFAMVPPVGIAELHMDPPDPLPYAGEGMMLGGLDHAGIDAFVEAVGAGSGSTLASAEIRHAGGALARPDGGHGALGTLDAAFVTYALGLAADDGMARTTREGLRSLARALAPYDSGRQYLNFTDVATDPAHFFRPATYRRLRRLKAAWDPKQLFRANHRILPS